MVLYNSIGEIFEKVTSSERIARRELGLANIIWPKITTKIWSIFTIAAIRQYYVNGTNVPRLCENPIR